MRKSVVVIHDPKIQAIHFTSTKLQGEDLWLPFDGKHENLHQAVEKLMVVNRIAHNVTRVERLRRCGICEEFEVVYNDVAEDSGNTKPHKASVTVLASVG